MSDIQFGTMNLETGETQEGYMKDGKMCYKPQSWLERLFSKPPCETKYIGLITMSHSWIWSSKETKFKATVYKDFNPFTNKIYKLYAIAGEHRFDFNVDAYINTGQLVMK